MARFFVLGPSAWTSPSRESEIGFSPLEKRFELAALIRECGQEAFLMREIETQPKEDLTEKFLRILTENQPTHCLLYWPAGATMGTAQDELMILRTLVAQGTVVPEVWIMAQDITGQEIRGEFFVHDTTGQSTYIRDLLRRVPCMLSNWCNHADLEFNLRENLIALE